MKIKLAEALLRRKELSQKVDVLKNVDSKALYEVIAKRQNVTESLDDVVAKVPKLTSAEVTSAYDWHARQLRRVDAAIQQANWTTELEVEGDVMKDYKPTE